VARAPGALLKGATRRPLQQLRARAVVPIHPNAWNRNSRKFAFWAFCELRFNGVLRSLQKGPPGRCALLHALATVAALHNAAGPITPTCTKG
jgi:hypothetical protein